MCWQPHTRLERALNSCEFLLHYILVPNYDLSGTARILTRLSLQFIPISPSRLLFFFFHLIFFIQSSDRRYSYCIVLIRGHIVPKENEDGTISLECVHSDTISASYLFCQQSCTDRYVAQQHNRHFQWERSYENYHFQKLRKTCLDIIRHCRKLDNTSLVTAFYSDRSMNDAFNHFVPMPWE